MFSTADWLILLVYFLFSFAVGIFLRKSASENMESYFLAGRSLPWWWLGTSMVATTFSADTPLAVTSIVANHGISGNWFWWCWVFTFIMIIVFFAGPWRRSGVLTDVELIELRYEGREAAILRGFKSLYLALVINCIILGWVFRAMSKITAPFIRWEVLLGGGFFASLQSHWPSFLIFDDLNNTITVLILLAVTVFYSSLSGIRGVIFTDLFQFSLAMIGSLVFTFLALDHAGGMSNVLGKLTELYGDKSADYLNFVPDFNSSTTPLSVFLIFIGVQWWVKFFSDGSGYFAQRINTARTEADARKGTFWFAIGHFVLRSWPWIIIGLISLVIYPHSNPGELSAYQVDGKPDYEMAYPLLMKKVLPAGLLGLVFTSLVAAFMSTVDTHINWGASYLINDVYARFIKKDATQKQLVSLSKFAVVLMAVLAILVASRISSVEKAWKFFISLAAGVGLPQMLRWLWYRANAWTEISGMSVSFVVTIFLYLVFPEWKEDYIILITALSSSAVAVMVTLLTKPVSEAKWRAFQSKTGAVGFWPGSDRSILKRKLGRAAAGVICIYSLLFGTGSIVLHNWFTGIALLALAAASFYFFYPELRRDSTG